MGATGKSKQIAGLKGGEQREAARQEYDTFVRTQQEKQRQRQGATVNTGVPQPAPQQRSAGVRMGPGYANRSFS
jgi:hypothetical protein